MSHEIGKHPHQARNHNVVLLNESYDLSDIGAPHLVVIKNLNWRCKNTIQKLKQACSVEGRRYSAVLVPYPAAVVQLRATVCNTVQERTFPCTRRSHNANKLPTGNVARYIIQNDLVLADSKAQILHFYVHSVHQTNFFSVLF